MAPRNSTGPLQPLFAVPNITLILNLVLYFNQNIVQKRKKKRKKEEKERNTERREKKTWLFVTALDQYNHFSQYLKLY